jgi:NAD(P)H-hydrate epimerase
MRLIEQLNASGVRILAVDVPSGLSADTGLPLEVAVRAQHTLSLGAVKHGLLKVSATPFVGRLEIASDIGLSAYPFDTELSWTEAGDFRDFPPRRGMAGHKGTFGHLMILAGSPGYHGAAVLAARGAQRAQPGLITLMTHPDSYVPVASQLQAVMVNSWLLDPVQPDSCSAILVGPGLAAPEISETLSRLVRRLWQDSSLPVIVDATALDWLPAGPCPDSVLRVMTPHPGEAARLLGSSVAEVQRDRPGAVRALSRRWGNCLVVLKGHQTVIGQGKGELSVNSSGNPHLAQGGAGDLLAGYIGGLVANPELRKEPGMALRFAVWQHGAAADSLSARQRAYTVEDLASVLGGISPEA